MSWRDNSSSSTNGTQDGSGGSMSGGGSVSGTGGGGFGGMRGQTTGGRGGYTFRGVPGSRNVGNWNTGGPVVGTGSIMGGIQPAPAVALPRAHPRPTGFMQPPVQALPPLTVPPIAPPIPRVSPFVKFDGPPLSNPGWGTDPTQPTSPISYGPIGGGKYQDRLPQPAGMGGFRGGWSNDNAGRVGGGQGGGGGGGW